MNKISCIGRNSRYILYIGGEYAWCEYAVNTWELNRHRYSVIYVHRTAWLFKIWKCFFHVLFQHAMAIRPKNSLLLSDRDTSGPDHKTLSHLLQPHPCYKGTLAIIFKLPKSHRCRFSYYADLIQYLWEIQSKSPLVINNMEIKSFILL